MSHCPRCNREVHCTERKVAFNRVWHAFCFSCYKCRKLLNAPSVHELDGELYCDACYRSLLVCLPCESYEPCTCCTDCCKPICKLCESCCIPPPSCENCDYPCYSLCMPRPCKPVVVRTKPCCCPTEMYLQPSTPKKRCNSVPGCLEDITLPNCVARCRSCSPACSGPPKPCCCCCPQPPMPRETCSYYSRNHSRSYGKDSPKINGPCFIVEHSPPKKCCPPKIAYPPPKSCCPPCATVVKKCTPRSPCCLQQQQLPREVPAGCCVAYNPPPRKPICYPPIKSCEAPPPERICYFPSNLPPQPNRCSCGAPNPCDCDLDRRRRLAICCNTPSCRRCGQKVYAAEKIMASGGAFHSSCFSCYCCHKPLEVTNVYENRGEIYCRPCYSKCFGVQGYGYGTTLQTLI